MTRAARSGWGSIVGALLVLAASAASAQDSRPAKGKKTVSFSVAATAFVDALTRDAPEGVKVVSEDSTPADLGWDAPKDTPARKVVVWHPNGAHRALGLLPLRAYSPRKGAWPRVVAVAPGLVVVEAPSDPVAMTRDAMEAARPGLQKALRSLEAWQKGKVLEGKDRPAPLRDAVAVTRYPHWLAVDLGPGQELSSAAKELGVIVWRRVAKDTAPSPPSVVARPE